MKESIRVNESDTRLLLPSRTFCESNSLFEVVGELQLKKAGNFRKLKLKFLGICINTTTPSATAMEDEWEEEEQLVVAELSGMISSDLLSSRQSTCKIVDIDSEQPMMQVGRYLFAGEYEDAIGTCVIFEEDGADSKPALKYKCHTMKKLMLQRTFLSERKEDEPVSNRIEVLALHDEESFGRKSAVCHYLDPIDTEKSVLDEPKDCDDPEMSDESADEVEETETDAGATLLDNSSEEAMNASSSSVLTATQEGDDGS